MNAVEYLKKYIEMRRVARVLEDRDDYSLDAGEMNPNIVVEMLKEDIQPDVVWEPFASQRSRLFTNMAWEHTHAMWVPYSLKSHNDFVRKADSTKTGPLDPIGGMLFHPTYFGSVPLCDDKRDVGYLSDRPEYMEALKATVELAKQQMKSGGLVCAVARDYRALGARIRLDYWFLEMFQDAGFELSDVWLSEPDVVLVFRRV